MRRIDGDYSYKRLGNGNIVYSDSIFPEYPIWSKDGKGTFTTMYKDIKYRLVYLCSRPTSEPQCNTKTYYSILWNRKDPPILGLVGYFPYTMLKGEKPLIASFQQKDFLRFPTVLTVEKNASVSLLQKTLNPGGLESLLMQINL